MSSIPNTYTSSINRTVDARFVNANLNGERGTSPIRYGVSSNITTEKLTSHKVYSTNEFESAYTAPKTIGTFGQKDIYSTPQIQSVDSNSQLINTINDLNAQLRRLTEKSDQLFNENRNLKKDSESLVLCRGRLEEKEGEMKKMISNNNFLETNIKNLKNELDRAYESNRQLQTQLTEMFNKNPGRFHMDTNTKKILSAEEYDLERKIKSLEEKLVNVEKERDRLFIQNYEFKKLHGEEHDGTEPEELMGMRYQNGLQIASLDLNKAKKKIESLMTENELIRNELNILRGIDCFEENEVKSELTRNDDQAKCRNRSTEKRQRIIGSDHQKYEK